MSIKEDVKNLLQDFKLYQVPVDPINVARTIGVEYTEGNHSGFEGTLLADGENAIISVSSAIREPTRKSFTCAHELGHYQYDLGSKNSFNCTLKDTTSETSKTKLDPKEIRANEFASELLMPTEFFLKEIKNKEPSWELIKNLSEKFGTSLQATANRFVKLSEHTCWLVIGKNGKLHRYTKSDWNDFQINLDSTLRSEKGITTWKESSANFWLYDNRKTRDKNLFYWPQGENSYGENLVLLWDEGNSLLNESVEISDDDYDEKGEFSKAYWGKKY